MIKDKLNPKRFTNIYYKGCQDLQIDYKQYMVLDTIVHHSKHNTYSKGKSYLIKYLWLAKDTISIAFTRLLQLNHITKEYGQRDHFLNADIKERLEFYKHSHGSRYLAIHHQKRKDLSLNFNQFALLSLFHSHSKNSGYTSAHAITFSNILGITERQYYNIKDKLETENLIINKKGNFVELTLKGKTVFA